MSEAKNFRSFDSARQEQSIDGRIIFSIYSDLLQDCRKALGIRDDSREPCPHNVLLVKEWIIVIPRRNGYFEGVSANSAGMMGMLTISNEELFNAWRDIGPGRILSELGLPNTEIWNYAVWIQTVHTVAAADAAEAYGAKNSVICKMSLVMMPLDTCERPTNAAGSLVGRRRDPLSSDAISHGKRYPHSNLLAETALRFNVRWRATVSCTRLSNEMSGTAV